MQWLRFADRNHDHSQSGSSSPQQRRTPINPDGAQAFSRRARTYNGEGSNGKEMTRDAKVYSLDDSDEDADSDDDDDDDERRHGGLGIRDGMSKIGAFFSNFTAPKGEGMGNPGPTSHPHLFPSHHHNKSKESKEERENEPSNSPQNTQKITHVYSIA